MLLKAHRTKFIYKHYFLHEMNLFWLSRNLKRNARYHCDQHVVKMPLEAVQLLYTAVILLSPDSSWRENAPWNKAGTERGYKATHVNHPLAIWVRQSKTNYLHCADYALSLCAEYKKRYHREAFVQHHALWLRENPPPALPNRRMTSIPLCIGQGKTETVDSRKSAVNVYRRFYREKKLSFARYRHSIPPKWLSN